MVAASWQMNARLGSHGEMASTSNAPDGGTPACQKCDCKPQPDGGSPPRIVPKHVANHSNNNNNASDNRVYALLEQKYKSMRDTMLKTSRDALTGYMFWTTERTFPFNLKREDYEKAVISFPKMKPDARLRGLDWPITGLTMVGNMRLDNVRLLLETTFENKIPGDFIECGVWRGGASIFARLVIQSNEGDLRHVWLADSFSGLPLPRTPDLSKDSDLWNGMNYLEVSLDEVEENFRALDLLDDRVHFCQGYFVDILPKCHPEVISVLRLDGDMYESTMVRIL